MTRCVQLVVIALLAILGLRVLEPAKADDLPVQTTWRLLDYVAVDYAGAVADGKVINEGEYAEMVEFTASVRERLAVLPPTAALKDLVRQAEDLQRAVQRKAAPDEVASLARKLGRDLLSAYPVPLAPAAAPDLSRAATLYQEQCGSCHGVTGAADGPGAKGLEPPAIAFTDETRARERSLFALYQVIEQGLEGTAMASFDHLPADERWALAFYIGQFAYADTEATKGEQLWRSDSTLRQSFPNLQALTKITPAELALRIGDDRARALIAFLRRHPEAVATAPSGGTLAIAEARLAESVQAYEAGDRGKAGELALAAYLDGFEPIEPLLSARDAALMRRIEGAMAELRALISRGASVDDVKAQSERVSALFADAERALSSREIGWGSSFLGAFTILLREGLEALLIVVAMIAFLRKVNRTDVMPYVHGGWIAALAAGGLTWVAATHLISISGASRELTEGFGSLFAAAVLVSVGIWMHGKAQADAWQKYVREKLSHVLSSKSAWFLFLLAFVVVYREAFETILFFTALWSEGSAVAMLAGVGAAIAVLAVTAWALLSYSLRLPITQFFSFSSILIAVLAVILAGKGVAGLQEAGLLDIRTLAWLPRVEILGVYPTREGVLAQVLTLAVIVTGFWYTSRLAARTANVEPASRD